MNKPMIKNLIRPFYFFFKRKKQKSEFKNQLLNNNGDIKIVVGSEGIYDKGWISTEVHFLDLLKPNDWIKYFREASISKILAEHVWEHLSYEDGCIAAQTCFKFLKEGGGRLRIAVPDGFHPGKEYIDHVKPGGIGPGADDHKILYNYKSITEMLTQAGFEVTLLEYFDESAIFHNINWDKNDGFVRRSIKFDERNKDGRPNYTSLIVDAIK